ncbi:MAG TPA: hypothetical protein VFT43_00780 [Candidatus Polarisedimenticolia bacterium]|nr:hypothetical protein [Candidatus Polarisedimenticolia bacterium]
MSMMRARQSEPFLPADVEEVALGPEPLVTVRAGDNLMIRVGAVDRQSGLDGIVATCRSRANHGLSSVGRWNSRLVHTAPLDNYYAVLIPIPPHSPTDTWELHEITLCDREGNRRTCVAGKDFEEMLFRVEGRNGSDTTPPRLLGVRFGRTGF